MNFRTDEEYLRKLTYLLDVWWWEDRALELMLKARYPKWAEVIEEILACDDNAGAIIGYFAQLTIEALKDRSLAEKLLSIYHRLAEQSPNFMMVFDTYRLLILEKHGWTDDLTPARIERMLEKFERKGWLDRVQGRFQEITDIFRKYRGKRQSDENPMYS